MSSSVGTLEHSIADWTAGSGAARHQKAIEVFRAIRHLPVLDIHTHYPTQQIALNTRWGSPTELFLGVPNASGMGFDHYAGTVMLGQGVSPTLVYGRAQRDNPLPTKEFEKERFSALVTALQGAYPNPTSQWFELALESVFGLKGPLLDLDAETIWREVQSKLSQDDFRPQELLKRHGIKVALTTDSPEEKLPHHLALSAQDAELKLLPTWRPDRALYPEQNGRYPKGDFVRFVNQIFVAAHEHNNKRTTDRSFEGFLSALDDCMSYFEACGCRAADFGIENFPLVFDDRKGASIVYEKGLREEVLTTSEAQTWKGFMLGWFCSENAKRGWAQYLHQGAARNINSKIFKAHGPDAGGDAPGENLNRKGFAIFLDFLNSQIVPESKDGTGLAKTVVFPINPEDYPIMLETVARFTGNGAGIRSKVQGGPPWWFNDTRDGNAAFIRLLAERGILENWVGMLSDARCLPSVIARFEQFRAILATELVGLYPRQSVEWIIKLARKISYQNAAEFLGVSVS